MAAFERRAFHVRPEVGDAALRERLRALGYAD
jgi:hypothetical protein